MRLSGTADAEETAIASKRNPTVRLVALPTRPCRPLSRSKKMSFPLTRRHKVFKYSNSCVDSILDWEFFSTETVPNHCKLAADMGPCRASKPRFHFDAASGECQPFNFGGCRGNANNFETIEQCRNECAAAAATATNPENPPKVPERAVKKEGIVSLEFPSLQIENVIAYSFAFKQRNTPGAYYLPTSDSAVRFRRDSITTASTINAKRSLGVDAWATLIILKRPKTVWPLAHNFKSNLLLLGQVRRHQHTKSRTHNLSFLLNARWFSFAARSSVARARASFEDVIPLDVKENEIVPRDAVCMFGNETMNLGDRLASEDPCEECVCSTPPEITCTRHTCPAPPEMPNAVCQSTVVPGQCCPDVSCLPVDAPALACTVISILY